MGLNAVCHEPDVFAPEYPKIGLSWRNVSDLSNGALSAVVGGWVRARVGANITLDCPVTGQ